MNYLDDFCVIRGSFDQGCSDQGKLISILRHIGFRISLPKLSSPCTVVRFLGINIDSVRLEMSLDGDKLARLLATLTEVAGRRKVTRKVFVRLAVVRAATPSADVFMAVSAVSGA